MSICSTLYVAQKGKDHCGAGAAIDRVPVTPLPGWHCVEQLPSKELPKGDIVPSFGFSVKWEYSFNSPGSSIGAIMEIKC